MSPKSLPVSSFLLMHFWEVVEDGRIPATKWETSIELRLPALALLQLELLQTFRKELASGSSLSLSLPLKLIKNFFSIKS